MTANVVDQTLGEEPRAVGEVRRAHLSIIGTAESTPREPAPPVKVVTVIQVEDDPLTLYCIPRCIYVVMWIRQCGLCRRAPIAHSLERARGASDASHHTTAKVRGFMLSKQARQESNLQPPVLERTPSSSSSEPDMSLLPRAQAARYQRGYTAPPASRRMPAPFVDRSIARPPSRRRRIRGTCFVPSAAIARTP